MKTLFANNETQNINNFSFDILTVKELACIKGGKEEDSYIDPRYPKVWDKIKS